jgi:hypothetical protein
MNAGGIRFHCNLATLVPERRPCRHRYARAFIVTPCASPSRRSAQSVAESAPPSVNVHLPGTAADLPAGTRAVRSGATRVRSSLPGAGVPAPIAPSPSRGPSAHARRGRRPAGAGTPQRRTRARSPARAASATATAVEAGSSIDHHRPAPCGALLQARGHRGSALLPRSATTNPYDPRQVETGHI